MSESPGKNHSELQAALRAEREARLAAERRAERLAAERDALAEALRQQAEELRRQRANLVAWEGRWRTLEASPAWQVVRLLQAMRRSLAPPASRREHWLSSLGWWVGLVRRAGPWAAANRFRQAAARRFPGMGRPRSEPSSLPRQPLRPLGHRAPETAQQAAGSAQEQATLAERRVMTSAAAVAVDIVICVHNAWPHVERCLASLVAHTRRPYRLILVDDGSLPETAEPLRQAAERLGAVHIRNQTARGYTRAANQGLAASTADYVVLLNSDTIVTPGWLDRLLNCAESRPDIGIVGPLSNTASWQSIPEVFDGADWATNPLPAGFDLERWAELVARDSIRLYPELPFLNGFCLLVKRAVVDAIGPFDEAHFGDGFGEENDYCLRARAAGWRLAVADDAYVWHAQSQSYSSERRIALAKRADRALASKYGRQPLRRGVQACAESFIMAGIRARARHLAERAAWLERGRRRFAGRRLLFLMPVQKVGGGANVVLTEARAMREMGVSVALVNWQKFRRTFEASYSLDLPVYYTTEYDFARFLVDHAPQFDAMVATVFSSLEALAEAAESLTDQRPVFGYYIQDVEPYFFPPGTEPFHAAWQSYRLIPDIVRFTKTRWVQEELAALLGVASSVVGPSLDIGLFRPRRHGWPERPPPAVRVAAMIRPETVYRAPQLTMAVLRDAAQTFGQRIEIVVFGCRPEDPAFLALPRDFAFQHAGLLRPPEVAHLLSTADVFVDFSSHQAMGLTALEAMAAGAVPIVPALGGAPEWARHGENALVVDSAQPAACLQALSQLVVDEPLRRRLALQGITDAAAYYPELPAYRILERLFPDS